MNTSLVVKHTCMYTYMYTQLMYFEVPVHNVPGMKVVKGFHYTRCTEACDGIIKMIPVPHIYCINSHILLQITSKRYVRIYFCIHVAIPLLNLGAHAQEGLYSRNTVPVIYMWT